MGKVVAAVLVLPLLVSCGSSGGSTESPAVKTHSMTVEVAEQGFAYCLSIYGGAATVRDASGVVVGTVTLPPSKSQANDGAFATRVLGDIVWVSSASVQVRDSDFYQVEIQGVAGSVTLQKSDLQANGWIAEIVCG